MDELRLPLGKDCAKCGDWKLLEEFARNRNARDGWSCWCKACHRQAARRYREKNPEKAAEAIRRYDKRNREQRAAAARERRKQNPQKNAENVRRYNEKNREKYLETKRKYYQNNREKIREYSQRYHEENSEREYEYYQRNKEYIRQRARQWFRANPGKSNLYQRRRRARKLGAEGSHTFEEWLALCEFYANHCLCCGEIEPLTADHVIPLSKGGSDDISNIQPLCGPCNSRKSTNSTDYRPI